jgi:DNA-binding transcriptional MerR regulator
MRYAMGEMSARSGLTARTIRTYIAEGYLDPPEGRGRGATYSEEQFLSLLVIARTRAQRLGWPEVVDRLRRWSLDEKRAFVATTEPPAEDASEEGMADGGDDVSGEEGGARRPGDGAGVAPPAAPGHPARGGAPSSGDGLPAGTSFVLAEVLPGLSLVVRHDAAPVVRRVAAEILARYAAPR